MRFFKAVELSEWCFLSEAILFIAFGKAPEVEWFGVPVPDENGRLVGVESRFHWQGMPDNFENDTFDFDFFDPEDFSAVGIDMPENYIHAASSILWGEIHDAYSEVEFHNKYFDRLDFELADKEEQLRKFEKAKAVIRDAGPLEVLFEKTNALFEVHLERVWAQLFSRIHSGDIVVEAVHFERWDELAEADRYELAGEFTKVPKEAFRVAHDFKQDEVFFDGKTYVATRVRVEQLLDFAGNHFQLGETLTAKSFGHLLILDSDASLGKFLGSTRRPRGAPPALDWATMEAQLEKMHKLGSMPMKKEACIQELMEYAHKKLGRRVGRSSVQRRLKNTLDRYYTRK
ncbi:hypothetical protein [Shimia sp. SDUM112013]|uniref:hypothetical protein n=1 Tax=Shimia sp. SDUM112013 TaxID=3136160 RepID=UPI0032EE9C17